MNSVHFISDTAEHTVVITRAADRQWHALEDGRVVGRGEASVRPDGRLFLSIDSWHDEVFDALADAMLAGLPRPLYTIVDETDADLLAGWDRVGSTVRRREWECLVPTDPHLTGLGSVPPPSGVTRVPLGDADERLLGQVDRVIRDEVETTIGWKEMPAEVLARPHGVGVLHPSKYAAAAEPDHYVGLARVVAVTREPRLGLIAVRADRRRRGIARALLADVLGSLHRSGTRTVSVELNESNDAAMALFDGIGAHRAGSNVELVIR